MGWELRVFFNTVDSKFDLWKFLGKKIGKNKEVRSDTYFHLHDKRYGLKLRGGNLLELKILQQNDGTAERWAKTMQGYIPLNVKGGAKDNKDVKWKDELAPHLGSSNDAMQVTQLLSTHHPVSLVTISKERHQEFIELASLKLENKGGCIAGMASESCYFIMLFTRCY